MTDCWRTIGVSGDRSCGELRTHTHCRNCPVYATAAAQLLDREISEEYRAEWTGYVAMRPSSGTRRRESVVAFRIGQEWLALSTSIFHSVAERAGIHSLPHQRQRIVSGLTNIRGELVVCVSLGTLLGIDTSPGAHREPPTRNVRERLLVIQSEGAKLAFPVHEVQGIYRYDPAKLQSLPSTSAVQAGRYSLGIIPWKGIALRRLDDPLVCSALARGLS